MNIDKENKNENLQNDIEFLNPDLIAQRVYDKLLGNNAVDLKEYVMKTEWDVYNDLKLNSKPIPKIYADVNM